MGHDGIFLMNEHDHTIKTATAVALARAWQAHGMTVGVYEIPDSLRMPHDVVDYALRTGQPEIVQGVIRDLAEGITAPAWLTANPLPIVPR